MNVPVYYLMKRRRTVMVLLAILFVTLSHNAYMEYVTVPLHIISSVCVPVWY